MRLLKARVVGFQSFGDSGDVEFADGINLIVGQNNSGKSALLRAFQPTLVDNRHRTPERWEQFKLPRPQVQLTISVAGDELRSAVLAVGSAHLPMLAGPDPIQNARKILSLPQVCFELKHSPNQGFTADYPSHGQFISADGQAMNILLQNVNGELSFDLQYNSNDTLASIMYWLWQRQMFFFSAERMSVGESGVENAARLTPDARNLPAVLLTLSGDRGDVFQRLVRHMREVFPTVGNISVRPNPNVVGGIEIRVWPTEAMERVELSFPLLQSGTGVSQVLAILTAVMTVEDAVLIIDEIIIFLHPSAVKALLRIIQIEYSHHQYIISTHAPEVVSFSNARTVHLVRRAAYESSVVKLNLENVTEFRSVADNLGISLADVFAADRVIWVEGPTEELCFPALYKAATGHALPRGVVFSSVIATGDFMAKRRDKELVYQIYTRLSQVAAPLLVSVAFSFDSESLSEEEKMRMVRDSRGAMHFLPRRQIECYLLQTEALFALLADRGCKLGDVAEVDAQLAALANSKPFHIPEWAGNLDDERWLSKVDAARLISHACAELSAQRVTFGKKSDSLFLMQYILANDAKRVGELMRYVEGLVKSVWDGSKA